MDLARALDPGVLRDRLLASDPNRERLRTGLRAVLGAAGSAVPACPGAGPRLDRGGPGRRRAGLVTARARRKGEGPDRACARGPGSGAGRERYGSAAKFASASASVCRAAATSSKPVTWISPGPL